MSIEINGLKAINPSLIENQEVFKSLEELEGKYRLDLYNDNQELKKKVKFIQELNVWKFKKRISFPYFKESFWLWRKCLNGQIFILNLRNI